MSNNLDNYHKSFMQSVYSNEDLDVPDSLTQLFTPYDNSTMDRVSRPNSFNTSSLFSSTDFGAETTTHLGNSMASIGTFNDGSTPPVTPGQTPVKNPKLYKTELCRSWVDSGRCNYGDRCQYAHGDAEKRPVPRHPKYKTEACQSFHQSGYCPYGARCHFIHNESEYSPNRQTPQQIPQSNYNNSNSSSRLNTFSSSVLQRVYSHPGYGSSGESPAGSSNDSGSESPNGSFSPALDLDDHPYGMGSFATPKIDRFHSFDPMQTSEELPYSLLSGLIDWSLDDEKKIPDRLPVFAQLSNPQ